MGKFRAFYKSKDEVPKDQVDHYRPATAADKLPDGAVVFDGIEFPPGWELRDTSNFDNALATAKQAKTEAEAEVARLKSSFGGMDPAEIGRKMKKLEELEKAGDDANERAKAAHKAAMEEVAAEHQAEIKKRDDTIAALTSEVDGQFHDTEISRAITESRANARKVTPVVRASTRVDVVEADGKRTRRLVVVDEKGEVRKVVNKTTAEFEPMSVRALLEEMKKGDWASDFEPEKGEPGEKRGAGITTTRVGTINGKPVNSQANPNGKSWDDFVKNPASGLNQRTDVKAG